MSYHVMSFTIVGLRVLDSLLFSWSGKITQKMEKGREDNKEGKRIRMRRDEGNMFSPAAIKDTL